MIEHPQESRTKDRCTEEPLMLKTTASAEVLL